MSGGAHYRLLGVALNPNARIQHALTKIYGIGKHQSYVVCSQLGLHPDMKVEKLYNDMDVIRAHVENTYPTKSNLDREIGENINDKINMGCYAGRQHQFGLPVRGQSVANAQTQKKMALIRQRTMGVPIFRENVRKRYHKSGQLVREKKK